MGRFISADTIAPGKVNPQNRNRYSYALNNPLIFTDPTGHCTEDGSDGENTADCEARLNELGQLGIRIVVYGAGLWSLAELTVFLEGAHALQNAFGWSVADFRRYVGPVNAGQSSEWGSKALIGSDASALSTPDFNGGTTMNFFQGSVHGVDGGNSRFFLETVVHELAHAMDFTSGGAHSLGMMAATGSYYRDPTAGEVMDDLSQGRATGAKYETSGTTPYGRNNHAEDWAESVSAYVLDRSRVDTARINYVGNLYGPRGRYGGGSHGAR